MSRPAAEKARAPACLIVASPSGHRKRIPLAHTPFTIGREGDNDLVLRDNRASRHHARIVEEAGAFVIEDLASKHGVFVNRERVQRHSLRHGDVIHFGFEDSYELTFALEGGQLGRLLDQVPAAGEAGAAAQNLAKLRAVLEVARALQTSLSTDDVLAAVVDAALTITGAERGFLLLREGDELEIRVARDAGGAPIAKESLQVPTRLLHRALRERTELLSMNFDPLAAGGHRPDASVAQLELRSVVAVPLVRVRTADPRETVAASIQDTVGLIYLDSRRDVADLSSGNRELLQSLAIEASTILENARLLEQERARQALEEEMKIARLIQQSLLPKRLPATGWFQAAGSSLASRQVGGDYFDVIARGERAWAAVVADVCGKGASSALLAALLQGAFLRFAESPADIEAMLTQLNRFLLERTGGEKYATLFYSILTADGTLRWANAAHCPPVLVRRGGALEQLEPTGMPVGLLDEASFEVRTTALDPGDKVVMYTDGLTEARNEAGQFFESRRLFTLLRRAAGLPCRALHEALVQELASFTAGAEQADDITLLVVEYRP
jgi:serine phosphatase RsbU (regulator of sigma subunit)